ncbi:hypothetical protein DFP74_2194 [Nocardiopsis sp. Huas11]|uniref:hypothetical protein n=1 Tax=Nocardiopsis sp. Huas11 TaxID=2183912 RepID=UPI000F0E1B7F|nr:hypothetical protein [Nocardiopsis sp. Huas11]RKS06556.1 hypothetical protein DFP74_2194 [Nocardiopsis sp. Huas11]
MVSFPDSVDTGGSVIDLWERRPLAPVTVLSEHYRHQIRNRGPLRTAAFRSCSCDWVERPHTHRPKHAKHATFEAEAEPVKTHRRRRRRGSRVRAYVSHPVGDLAPLALAVRSWISMIGASGPDGSSAQSGHRMREVA